MNPILSRMIAIKRFLPVGSQILLTNILTTLCRSQSICNLMPPPIVKKLWVEKSFKAVICNDIQFVYAATRGDCVGRDLYWNVLGDEPGGEEQSLVIFSRLSKLAKNLIVDVGANTGIYSLVALASNPRARILAFEPVPWIFKLLNENLSINNWHDRCQVRQAAVSDFDGQGTLYVPAGPCPSSATLNLGFSKSLSKEIAIDIEKLDTVIPASGLVDLVKIDVEGSEHRVLEGMRRILEQSHPTIILEALITEGASCESVNRTLTDYGYRFFNVRKDSLREERLIKPIAAKDGVTTLWRNWLCIYEHRSDHDVSDLLAKLII